MPAQTTVGPAEPEGHGFSYLFLTGQRPVSPAQLPFLSAMENAGWACRDPHAGEGPDSQRVKAMLAFGDDYARLWAFWGVRLVFAPTIPAGQIQRAGLAKGLMSYKVAPDPPFRLLVGAPPLQSPVAALEPTLLTPPLAVYHSWRGVGEGFDAALTAWTAPDFDPASEIAVAGLGTHRSADPPDPAAWSEGGRPRQRDWLSAGVAVENASGPGLLLVRARRLADRPVEAFVNGEPARVLPANGYALAVEVPGGRSAVELRVKFPARALASGLAGVAAFATLFACWLRAGRKERAA